MQTLLWQALEKMCDWKKKTVLETQGPSHQQSSSELVSSLSNIQFVETMGSQNQELHRIFSTRLSMTQFNFLVIMALSRALQDLKQLLDSKDHNKRTKN